MKPRHLIATALVLALAAAPAAAQDGSAPPVDLDLLGLKPVGDSPLSGLAYLRERPGRLRAHVALADARQPVPDALEEVAFTFDKVRCGEAGGEPVEVVARHVAGRGLEYTGSTSGTALGRPRSLSYVEDENKDGDFEDSGERKACGSVRRVRGQGSVAELKPAEGSDVSGLAVASGRTRFRVVLTMLNNKNPDLLNVVAARGRCGAPAGRTFELFGDTDEYDLVESIRTPSGGGVLERTRSLRVVTDLDGDGQADPATCGLVVTTSNIDAD